MIEIILSFFTSYSSKGARVLEFRKCALKYLKTCFIPDLIVLVAMFAGIRGEATNLLVAFKFFSLKKNFNRINSVLVLNEDIAHIMSLVKLVLAMITISHILGLLWYALARYEMSYGEEETWIHVNEIVDTPWEM